MTNHKYSVGDRVLCVEGGAGFPGLLGTVARVEEGDEELSGDIIDVEWDISLPKSLNATAPSGGSWRAGNLRPAPSIEAEDIAPEDRDAFDALPIGSTMMDKDGWQLTKVANSDPVGYFTVDTVNTLGEHQNLVAPWNYGPLTNVRVPEAAVAKQMQAEEESGRPVVNLSAPRHGTARSYAGSLVGHRLDAADNEILERLRDGEDVDALEALDALVAAMRSGLTRFNLSTDRRDHGRRVAHLIYIVRGILGNHVDGLPAYETGERSRLLEEAKVLLADAREEVDAGREALETERRKSYGLQEERDTLAAEVAQVRRDRDTLALVTSYAIRQADPVEAARIFGYWDAVNGD